jgi:hypothetical protein
MCWNSQVYGILTTAAGFGFLSHDNDGHLWISQMFGANENSAIGSGYVLPSSLSQNYQFTVSYMLYWFTRLTETTKRMVERDRAEVIRVMDRHQTKPVRLLPLNVTNQPHTSPIVYILLK